MGLASSHDEKETRAPSLSRVRTGQKGMGLAERSLKELDSTKVVRSGPFFQTSPPINPIYLVPTCSPTPAKLQPQHTSHGS